MFSLRALLFCITLKAELAKTTTRVGLRALLFCITLKERLTAKLLHLRFESLVILYHS